MQQSLFTYSDPLRSLKAKYHEVFEKTYNELNPEQKRAVDHIDGAIMVVAGPGTGKTQILAVRIGKILKETDTAPHNILCLTFTDAATLSMRKRLVETIGPDAHKIHIYTFHSFCNTVIQENLGVFGDYRQLDLLSDLEEIEVYQEILDSLPSDHILKNLKGNDQFEMKRLKNLFQLLKKENISSQQVIHKIEDFLRRKKLDTSDSKFFYQRKYKEFQKGDPKPGAWEDIEYRMNQLKEASMLLSNYLSIMDRKNRYDYQDMILWVLKEFQQNDLLLQKYQERYQYVLVDEYQDTNGAQNQLLEILISFWEEDPNVFVVGDDDQAIYKFQGANMDNIKDFKEKYNPSTVVLERNYRSSQPILDGAKKLIAFNSERLVNEEKYNLSKDLIASGPNKELQDHPKILSFQNETQENVFWADYLTNAFKNEEDLSKVAFLYRQHSQVSSLVEVLERRNIPINIKKSVNILTTPLVQSLLTILSYISIEHKRPNMAEDKLAELMYYSFFNLKSNDVARISLENRKQSRNHNEDSAVKEDQFKMRDIIANEEKLIEIGVKEVDKVMHLSTRLDDWISAVSNVTLQMLFEKIINEGLILQTVLRHSDKTWFLQVLNTFFDFIKSETGKKQNLNLEEFLDIIETMKINELPLNVNKVISSENGAHFITAHSAKGLEYEKVILKGATKNIWDKSSSTRFQYTFPDNLNEDTETNEQDERRLFFVAVTRAEKELIISYSEKKDEGKVLGASQFVDEFAASSEYNIDETSVSEQALNGYLADSLSRTNKKPEIIDHDLIDRKLEGYKLSVTGLNKYLRCPLSYYFEDILQIPSARNKYMGFGRAIHFAFQKYYEEINGGKGVKEDTLHHYFQESMKDHHSHFTHKEYDNLSAYGKSILSKYYSKHLAQEQRADRYELELKLDKSEYDGVPLKGVLDNVAISKTKAKVTDYKTGNFGRYETKKKLKPPSEKEPVGGDYWRQIVFYKILSQSDTNHPWVMESGTMDFVEPDKKTQEFYKKEYIVSQEDIDIVGSQITESWTQIHNHKFEEGCGEENCYWCNFIQNDFVFAEGIENDVEDTIQNS